MLKRICIFWIVTLLAFDASAGFWDALAECFKNPCNCGFGDRIENWNGADHNKGDENPLCPPWNKDGGRHDNICLVQFDFPPIFTPYWQRLCAEYTPESDYFTPKIRVRGQQCNAIACWTTSNTLDWDGDCVTLAGPYGLPLTRMCARVALPYDPIRDWPQDPGYTPGEHLNFEGARVPDDPIYDFEGNELQVESPKLCAYLDPAFLGTGEDGFDVDFFDLDPNEQVFHKTDKLHPVVRVIIFFLDMMSSVATAPADLFSALFNMMDTGEEGETTFAKVLGKLFEAISWLIDAFFELIKSVLKAIGQINRVVSPNDYGCVNIPLGPYPPPFCEDVAPTFQPLSIQRICETDSSGVPVPSEEPKLCVVSKIRNNFIHNAVRAGYEQLIPLCEDGEDPLTTDKCVTIENLPTFSTPAAMHTVTSLRDVIPHCNDATGSEPCVKTMLEHRCSVSSPDVGCEDGFRVVYGTKVGTSFRPQEYYRHDLNDCATSSSLACQDIWGINTGEFIDIALQFPAQQLANLTTPLSDGFTLNDRKNQPNPYSASIVHEPTFHTTAEYYQLPRDICVFGIENVEGCIERASFTKPLIFNCDPGYDGLTCTSDYFQPRLIISAQSGSDKISAVVTPLSIYNTSAGSNYSAVTIAGYEFDSFVTDESDARRPFSGPKAQNPSTLYGTYKDNAAPYDGAGNENTDALYLTGLEYITGDYFRGGKKVCINTLETDQCPTDTTQCVLTNLRNRDVVNCNTFLQKAGQYLGLKRCDASFTACTGVDSIPAKFGGAGAVIYSCTTPNGSGHCYTYAGSAELCEIGTLPSERVTPSPSLGDILGDGHFYNIEGSPGDNYDKSLYALRNKTSYERNLCTDIPQPSCRSRNQNSANWPETLVGEISYGTCNNGMVPKGPLERYCIVNSNTKTFAFEPITSDIGCENPYCPSEEAGNANWPRVNTGTTGIGTCKPGFNNTNRPALRRDCNFNAGINNGQYEPIGSLGCVPN